MKKTALMIRCVPRCGFDSTEVRTVDLDVPQSSDEEQLRYALDSYLRACGVDQAVYDIAVDDDGFFAVINDEAYDFEWGTPLL